MQCPKCSVFSRAIHESGLEELIGGARRITIFAPTDDAFARWPQEKVDQLFQCKAALAAIVLNHIAPESLSPAELLKMRSVACCCNYDDCVKYCGKKRADELALHCPAVADKETKPTQTCVQDDGTIGLGAGRGCCVAPYPFPAIRCDNGYVYPIDRVQIPRGLKVYQALKAQENQPDGVVEFELVEIMIPDETAPADAEKPAETAPADAEKPAETAPADAEKPAETAPEDAEKPAETAPEDAEKPAETAPADAEKPAETAPADAEKTADAPKTDEKSDEKPADKPAQ